MKTEEFDYHLPKELIAQHPLKDRAQSKLMVCYKDHVEHVRFKDIINYVNKNDVFVINETKVVKSKIIGRKETGGKVELTIIEKLDNNLFKCFIKGRKPKGIIYFNEKLFCKVIDNEKSIFIVKFNKDPKEFIQERGDITLPPYIKNKVDIKEYQTIFANQEGSIAAPTAGFHFTKQLVNKMLEKGVIFTKICLHVGIGTFEPVTTTNIEEHKMHKEFFYVPYQTAEIINNRKGRLFIVGTTSLRALESATDSKGTVHEKSGYTNLFIYPGYKFKLDFDALITNFHLPKSTLIMLVSAIMGLDKTKEYYKLAIKKRYRFYSFGDAMLIFRKSFLK